ncbi:MAG: hypothetical protein NC231_07995 [Bacillus sp. (in: Bacteria)]|nr:hypothetical protein [Bacillus sp. (in: firmicutes)]MCM1425150.1 hypothetical protein [Eubacterium sp.]
MKLKRVMAVALASVMLMSSMTVFAKNYGTTEGAPEPEEGETLNQGDTYTDKSSGDSYTYDGSKWVKDTKPSTGDTSGSGATSVSSVSSSSASNEPKILTREDIEDIVAQAEALAFQAEAEEEGFADVAAMQSAAEKNMSAGEYYNNAVVETPGIEEATPVAQGGGIIINGVETKAMATISKVDRAFVDSVRASVEGTVLNVVDVQFPAFEATINFYMPGIAANADIAAVQYIDGAWVDVEVVEVRADHVVLNLKKNGKVAFLSK